MLALKKLYFVYRILRDFYFFNVKSFHTYVCFQTRDGIETSAKAYNKKTEGRERAKGGRIKKMNCFVLYRERKSDNVLS